MGGGFSRLEPDVAFRVAGESGVVAHFESGRVVDQNGGVGLAAGPDDEIG